MQYPNQINEIKSKMVIEIKNKMQLIRFYSQLFRTSFVICQQRPIFYPIRHQRYKRRCWKQYHPVTPAIPICCKNNNDELLHRHQKMHQNVWQHIFRNKRQDWYMCTRASACASIHNSVITRHVSRKSLVCIAMDSGDLNLREFTKEIWPNIGIECCERV